MFNTGNEYLFEELEEDGMSGRVVKYNVEIGEFTKLLDKSVLVIS